MSLQNKWVTSFIWRIFLKEKSGTWKTPKFREIFTWKYWIDLVSTQFEKLHFYESSCCRLNFFHIWKLLAIWSTPLSGCQSNGFLLAKSTTPGETQLWRLTSPPKRASSGLLCLPEPLLVISRFSILLSNDSLCFYFILVFWLIFSHFQLFYG